VFEDFIDGAEDFMARIEKFMIGEYQIGTLILLAIILATSIVLGRSFKEGRAHRKKYPGLIKKRPKPRTLDAFMGSFVEAAQDLNASVLIWYHERKEYVAKWAGQNQSKGQKRNGSQLSCVLALLMAAGLAFFSFRALINQEYGALKNFFNTAVIAGCAILVFALCLWGLIWLFSSSSPGFLPYVPRRNIKQFCKLINSFDQRFRANATEEQRQAVDATYGEYKAALKDARKYYFEGDTVIAKAWVKSTASEIGGVCLIGTALVAGAAALMLAPAATVVILPGRRK